MGIQVISFHCVLKNKLGRVISSTFNQGVLTHPQSESTQLPALGEALKNLAKGERRRVCLRAEDAYGYYDPKKVLKIERSHFCFSGAIRIGDEVMFEHQGTSQPMRVIEKSRGSLTLDGNHPLAGQDLIFEIEATDARDATREEILDAAKPDDVSLYH